MSDNNDLTLENFTDPGVSHERYVLTSPRSLRACHKLRIKPVDLLPRDIAEFDAAYERLGYSPDKVRQLYLEYEANRKVKLALARKQRDLMIIESTPKSLLPQRLDDRLEEPVLQPEIQSFAPEPRTWDKPSHEYNDNVSDDWAPASDQHGHYTGDSDSADSESKPRPALASLRKKLSVVTLAAVASAPRNTHEANESKLSKRSGVSQSLDKSIVRPRTASIDFDPVATQTLGNLESRRPRTAPAEPRGRKVKPVDEEWLNAMAAPRGTATSRSPRRKLDAGSLKWERAYAPAKGPTAEDIEKATQELAALRESMTTTKLLERSVNQDSVELAEHNTTVGELNRTLESLSTSISENDRERKARLRRMRREAEQKLKQEQERQMQRQRQFEDEQLLKATQLIQSDLEFQERSKQLQKREAAELRARCEEREKRIRKSQERQKELEENEQLQQIARQVESERARKEAEEKRKAKLEALKQERREILLTRKQQHEANAARVKQRQQMMQQEAAVKLAVKHKKIEQLNQKRKNDIAIVREVAGFEQTLHDGLRESIYGRDFSTMAKSAEHLARTDHPPKYRENRMHRTSAVVDDAPRARENRFHKSQPLW